jgi:hypothetical protein
VVILRFVTKHIVPEPFVWRHLTLRVFLPTIFRAAGF